MPDNTGREQQCSSSVVQSSETHQMPPSAVPGHSLSHQVGIEKMEKGKLWLQCDVGMHLLQLTQTSEAV